MGKLEHKDIWHFTYKNIYCEIAHWGTGYMCDGKGMWNSYLYLWKNDFGDNFEKMIVKQVKCKSGIGSLRKRWEYGDILDLFDFHGDITFYKPIRDQFNGKIIGLQVGNDYGHLWDIDKEYDENIIAYDLKLVVDNLLEKLK